MYKILCLLSMLLLIGCGSSVPQKCLIYDSGEQTFKYIKLQTDEALQALVNVYQKNDSILVKEQCKAPKGFYGEYGFLMMQRGQNDEGRQLMRKEIENYPESQTFMLRALGEKE